MTEPIEGEDGLVRIKFLDPKQHEWRFKLQPAEALKLLKQLVDWRTDQEAQPDPPKEDIREGWQKTYSKYTERFWHLSYQAYVRPSLLTHKWFAIVYGKLDVYSRYFDDKEKAMDWAEKTIIKHGSFPRIEPDERSLWTAEQIALMEHEQKS